MKIVKRIQKTRFRLDRNNIYRNYLSWNKQLLCVVSHLTNIFFLIFFFETLLKKKIVFLCVFMNFSLFNNHSNSNEWKILKQLKTFLFQEPNSNTYRQVVQYFVGYFVWNLWSKYEYLSTDKFVLKMCFRIKN